MNWCGVLSTVLIAFLANNAYVLFQKGVEETTWVGANGFGFHTTAEEVSEGVDLSGKVALVTGGNSGLGFETSRVLALRGAHVIVVARSLNKAKEAIASIKEQLPSGREYQMTPLACDLSSLGSVSQAAQDFKAMGLPLHYLMANAGIMALPQREESADGYEMQIAVNHLGHFHLVTQLLDSLQASAPARVVFVSSVAHEDATTPRAFLTSDTLEMPYSAWGTYGDSKLANVVFARELNERYRSKGVLAYVLHPGIIETNLARSMSLETLLNIFLRPNFPRVLPTLARTIPEGTATQVYAALRAPEEEAGMYLSNCNVEVFGITYAQVDAGLLDNAAVRAKFWATSEKLVQQALAKL